MKMRTSIKLCTSHFEYTTLWKIEQYWFSITRIGTQTVHYEFIMPSGVINILSPTCSILDLWKQTKLQESVMQYHFAMYFCCMPIINMYCMINVFLLYVHCIVCLLNVQYQYDNLKCITSCCWLQVRTLTYKICPIMKL